MENAPVRSFLRGFLIGALIDVTYVACAQAVLAPTHDPSTLLTAFGVVSILMMAAYRTTYRKFRASDATGALMGLAIPAMLATYFFASTATMISFPPYQNFCGNRLSDRLVGRNFLRKIDDPMPPVPGVSNACL